jgi:tetratricopeptide (TPR) repeat protein
MRFPALLLAAALPASAQFWSELANPKVEVTLTHPPGLGLKIDRVAFLPGKDLNSRELADTLTADLVESHAIEVVDRTHLDSVLKEQELGANGYIDPSTVASLGKLLGPTALVVVNVNRSELSRNQATKEEKYRDYQTKEDKVRLIRSSITSLDFSATAQVIDLATGRIFGVQRLEATPSLTTTSDKGWPPYPKDSDVRRLAYQDARGRLLRLLLPWTEVRKLTFFDDKTFGMEKAHELIEAKRYGAALERALAGLDESKRDKGQKPKYYPRAYYNVGILHFIEGRYDEARPFLQQALDMDPEASIFKNAYRECLDALDLQAQMRQVDQKSAAMAKPASASKPAPSAAPSEPAKVSAEERLKKLQELYKKGLLDKKDYDQKKAEILKEL